MLKRARSKRAVLCVCAVRSVRRQCSVMQRLPGGVCRRSLANAQKAVPNAGRRCFDFTGLDCQNGFVVGQTNFKVMMSAKLCLQSI